MARRTTTPPSDVPEKIVDIDVSDEMRGSFLEYAYSVIYSRACSKTNCCHKRMTRILVPVQTAFPLFCQSLNAM